MDTAATIEAVIAGVLKPRGFRKRARNWFRTTSADEYQVVNLPDGETSVELPGIVLMDLRAALVYPRRTSRSD